MKVSSVFVKTPVHDGLSTSAMEYRIVQDFKSKAGLAQTVSVVKHYYNLLVAYLG